MSRKKEIQHIAALTRREFLKYAGAGVVASAVIGMVPEMPILGPVGWRAYAQSQGKISDEWWKLAAKYGPPTGKFGQVGEAVNLTVAYQPLTTGYWNATVNKQARLWAKYLPPGSTITWFAAPSGPLIIPKMLAGEAPFGYMAETPALVAGDKFFCDMVAATGYDLGETGAICVRQDLIGEARAQGPKFLDGKPVGVTFGSYSHRQMLNWMAQNQVKPDLQHQTIKQQEDNLKAKQIAAAACWEPYPSWLEMQGVAAHWVTGLDMPSTCAQYNPQAAKHCFRVVGAVLAPHEWLRDRPDVMGAYLKAEEEARDLLTNALDLAAFYISRDISEVPRPVVRVTLDMMIWDGRLTPECRQHILGVARMWRDLGFLKSKRSQDADKYVSEFADDRFLQLAIKELAAQGQWTSEKLPGFPQETDSSQLKRHSWKEYEKIQLQEKPWKPTRG